MQRDYKQFNPFNRMTRMQKLKYYVQSNTLYKKIRAAWLDYKYPTVKEQPDGFLMSTFKKACVVTVAGTVTTVALMPFAGGAMQRGWRSLTRDNSLALDIRKQDNFSSSRSDMQPITVGTAEVSRTIDLQENMLTLGLPLGKCGANGDFTADDLRAVNWFRQMSGLPESEFVDKRTIDEIAKQAQHRQYLREHFTADKEQVRDMLVFQPSIFTPSAREKRKIRDIQIDLLQAHYDIGPCKLNGEITAPFTAAVEKFQRDNKIYPVTSAIGPDLRRKIGLAAKLAEKQDGTEEVVEKQGADKMAAVLYGQTMSEQEIKDLAVKYIKERGVPEYVVQAVMDASLMTGMDFTYMMDMCSIESGFRPWAGAGTSTAVGNFQFIEETWLHTFRKHAGKYGYSDLVKKMDRGPERQFVFDLRKDPKISSLMAAEFALENLQSLKDSVGGAIGKPEVYLAHFLGAGDAAPFIAAFRKDPSQAAAPLFAAASKANPTVFFNSDGTSRTMGDVYKMFARKMSGHILRMTKAKEHKKLTDTLAAKPEVS